MHSTQSLQLRRFQAMPNAKPCPLESLPITATATMIQGQLIHLALGEFHPRQQLHTSFWTLTCTKSGRQCKTNYEMKGEAMEILKDLAWDGRPATF